MAPRTPKPYVAHGFTVSLVRDSSSEPFTERPRLNDPEAAWTFARTLFPSDDQRERFVAIFLTVRQNVIGYSTISIGCLTASLVHPRELFRPAILAGAASIVVAHNHPSGDAEPSPEDAALTRRLVSAGSLLGIEVLDHIVVGEGRFVSLKQRGVL
jgi:DNA repair protein RadC